jgi:very-short-patch-repair endonuclease
MVTFKPRDTNRAQSLRNEATPAERELWKFINRRQIGGHKFSRQMPVGPYFVDFLCRELSLILEVDGFSHDTRQSYDAKRTAGLEAHGYRVIRFTNQDVFVNIEGVVKQIELVLSDIPTPNPSRRRGGDS